MGYNFKFKDCVDEEPTTVIDITMQIAEKWNDQLANQITSLLQDLSTKYGNQFDEVLELIDGFTGSAISQIWQAETEEGHYNEFHFIFLQLLKTKFNLFKEMKLVKKVKIAEKDEVMMILSMLIFKPPTPIKMSKRLSISLKGKI